MIKVINSLISVVLLSKQLSLLLRIPEFIFVISCTYQLHAARLLHPSFSFLDCFLIWILLFNTYFDYTFLIKISIILVLHSSWFLFFFIVYLFHMSLLCYYLLSIIKSSYCFLFNDLFCLVIPAFIVFLIIVVYSKILFILFKYCQ